MKSLRFSAILSTGLLTVALVVSVPPSSHAFLGFGKNPNRKMLTKEELASQETVASELFTKAQSLESAGSIGKARDVYGKIVKLYPRTKTAGESQFKVAELRQAEGKGKKAFTEYQDFLENYKGSEKFGEAVKRQYDIAKGLMSTKKKGFWGGIGAAVQPSKLIEMFEQISNNAPRTDMSAKSQLAIGKIHAQQSDLTASILAYEAVVEEYPNSQYAKEAQYSLFDLHGRESERSFSPVDLRQQQEAGEDFVNQFGSDPRAGDIKAALGKLEDKESEKAFDIGRFYERRGNLKSAAVYYRQVLRHPGSKQYENAKKRLSGLIEADPSLATIGAQVRKPAAPTRPSSAAGAPSSSGGSALPPVKKTADLLGPPPPDVKSAKPKMRTSSDDVLPIPTDEPASN